MRTLFATAAEMQARLGGIPLERIRMNPALEKLFRKAGKRRGR